MTATEKNDFDMAVAALYSATHQARTKEDIQKSAVRRECTIQDMRLYMQRADLAVPSSLSVIHITGTKGKGSTACLCESILRRCCGLRTGLFTSPHLVEIRERIRIGGLPVSKEVFAQAYWTLRERLEKHNHVDEEIPPMPGYFRMLTLIALFIFSNYEPSLDVIILEVGMGGRFDATNIIDMDGSRKIACGVTLLDLDHTRVLGDTLEQIAWEKGGIFQVQKGSRHPSSPRPSMQINEIMMAPAKAQPEEEIFFAIRTNIQSVLKVLEMCAAIEGEGRRLAIVGVDPALDGIEIGLQGSHQLINASLAIALCDAVVGDRMAIKSETHRDMLMQALRYASWPGRCQTVIVDDHQMTVRLDGAHTPKSLEACVDWFRAQTKDCATRHVLIFNCSHERNPVPLLQQLHSLHCFERIYFCLADFERPSGIGKPKAAVLLAQEGLTVGEDEQAATASEYVSPTWQETLSEIWTYLDRKENRETLIEVNLNVKQAMEQIRSHYSRIDVLVSGSLYLVGSALNTLGWHENDASGRLILP